MEAEEPRPGAPAPIPATAELTVSPEELTRTSQTPAMGSETQEGREPSCEWAEGRQLVETQQGDVRDETDCGTQSVTCYPKEGPVDVGTSQENLAAEAWATPECQEAESQSWAESQPRAAAPLECQACPSQRKPPPMAPVPSALSRTLEEESRPELPALTPGTGHAEADEETSPRGLAQLSGPPSHEECLAETILLPGSEGGTLRKGQELQGAEGAPEEQGQEQGQEPAGCRAGEPLREAVCSAGLPGEQGRVGEQVNGMEGRQGQKQAQTQDDAMPSKQGEREGLKAELGGLPCDEWPGGTRGQEDPEVGEQKKRGCRGPEEGRVDAQDPENQSVVGGSVSVPGRQGRGGVPAGPMLEEEEDEEEEEEEAEDWNGAALWAEEAESGTEEGEEPDGPPALALAAPETSSPGGDLFPGACQAAPRVPGTQTELPAERPPPVALTPALEPMGSAPQPFSTAGSPDHKTAPHSQQEGPELGTRAASSRGAEVDSGSAPETPPRTPGSVPVTPGEASPSASRPIAIPRKKASPASCSPEVSRATFSISSPSPGGASEPRPAPLLRSPSAEAAVDPGGSSDCASPQSPLASFPGAVVPHVRSNSFPGSRRTQLTPDLEGVSLSFLHSELPQRPPKPAVCGSAISRRDGKSTGHCGVIPEASGSSPALGQDSREFTSSPDRPSGLHSRQPWGPTPMAAFAPGSPAYGSSPPLAFVDGRPQEPAPPALPEKRHVRPSTAETDGHRSGPVPTLRRCSCPPSAPSPGPRGPRKGPLPKVPDPLVARQYRPLPSTPDEPPHAQTSFSTRLRYNKPLPPTPDSFQPRHSLPLDDSPRVYRPPRPAPVPEPLTEPPPLPPKSRGRTKSVQEALMNSGGQAKSRPVGQEWTVSSPHSAGRTSWPPATGRSTDSLAPTSRSKREASPGMAFSNTAGFPGPSSPTTPWILAVQGPACEPGLSGGAEAPARGSLRRAAPPEGADGLRRSDLGQSRQPEKPGHPHLEKASSWPHRGDPGRPPQGSSGQTEASVEASNKPKGWHRQGLRRPSILPEGTPDTRGPAPERSFGSSDTIIFREKKPKEVMGGFSRRCSKLINSSQLLYQEYSDVVLNKEIQSQQRLDGLAEAPGLASPRQPRKALVSSESYLQHLSMASQSSLWQEIPVVRNSTALLSMTHEDQKLQEAKFELIVSEASYLRSLNIAVDHFQLSAQLRPTLTNQEHQWLFSRLQDVRDVSSTFLSDLEENFENNIFTFHVCDVVLNHASHFRRVYLPYVTNQTYQERTFQNLLNTNSSFRDVLEKLESDPICQRLSLKSFLILPFQRITRLKLLLQNILKRTQPGSSEEAEATKAHHALEELIRDCNSNVQRMRHTEELIYLSQKIEFECKIFPLISQSRWLVKSGELAALEFSMSPGLRRKLNTRPVHLHLFNDCLLLSRPREGSRFLVFDHAPFSAIRGEKCEMKLHGLHKNLFRLFLLHNTQGTQSEFLFSTETQSEKLRWISALATPREELDLLECCDSPQVQCLRAYKPRENDELALEKADVVMVTQQSNDGWLEGMRLSDGERGWFPVQQVEFISNPEVRARNLKEAHRVKTAKLQLVEQQT
ncbi:rho guanine nucleotide exchange factor 5 [Artibeus jamaicensis]|uniref:rho guanine nucleotide exchange factor 5 n=1 Tax=Artibeus jamaicensis TaxID=9417 RepID=UPI00235A47C9|nr:rho guanine nucleotide exchange factor 5 [Artibeus jamaicensis]XP_036999521.2 rho guanine nucleotide exchange factor 5 [Artibeus jamaicensis]XP_053519140.1 rho guanine nucleotide exchange factor 5 [Artibeus jamaicensis]